MNIKERMKVKEIAELTAINDHSAALQLGLSLLNDNDTRAELLEELAVVMKNHEEMGHLDQYNYAKRFDIYTKFKAEAIKQFSDEDYSKIYDAF